MHVQTDVGSAGPKDAHVSFIATAYISTVVPSTSRRREAATPRRRAPSRSEGGAALRCRPGPRLPTPLTAPSISRTSSVFHNPCFGHDVNRLDDGRVVDLVHVVLVLEHAVQAREPTGQRARRHRASSGRRTPPGRSRQPPRSSTTAISVSSRPRGLRGLDRLAPARPAPQNSARGNARSSCRPIPGGDRTDRQHDQRERHRPAGRREDGCRVHRAVRRARAVLAGAGRAGSPWKARNTTRNM